MGPGKYVRTPEIRLKHSVSGKGRKTSEETKAKLSKAFKGRFSGKANPMWKGGVVRDSSGYVLVKMPSHPCASANGYVREHRFVMEQHIGRILTASEHVHHINGDKADNRIENLQLVTPTEHQHEHHKGAKRSDETRRRLSEKAQARWNDIKQTVECAECKTVFPRRKRGGKYCGVTCFVANRKRRGWHPPGVGAKISATKKKRHVIPRE